MNTAKTIQFAVQSNGRLTEPSLQYLRAAGLEFTSNGRTLITSCTNRDLNILYLRNADIPEYVSRGVADYGIVGENVLLEKGVRVTVRKKLGFGRCALVIAVPNDSLIRTVRDLDGERIATSYPRILNDFLKAQGINAAVIPIQGSVEIAPSVNLADAICDLTQSGETLRANNLRVLANIMDSEAVLISNQLIDNPFPL